MGLRQLQLNSEQKEYIERLYYEMYAMLCTYSMSALNDCRLAEEAVQDTFRIACMKIDSLRSSSNPKGWLVNTLKYVIKNIRKSQASLNSLMIAMLSEENMVISSYTDEVDFNVTYSQLLGKDEFELLKMTVLDKYTILEIAQHLGISVEACKKRIQRAKKRLGNILEKNF